MATGFLHPGAMGASLAAVCRGERLWCGDGRSAATRERAEAAGLDDVGSLDALVERADVIISVCPPAAARRGCRRSGRAGVRRHLRRRQRDLAGDVTVDRRTVRTVRRRRRRRSSRANRQARRGSTSAATIARLRSPISGADTLLETRLVDGGAGAASAVKICFAAWTKGSAALLLAIRALAAAEGVDDTLLAEWATSMPGLADQAERSAVGQRTEGVAVRG